MTAAAVDEVPARRRPLGPAWFSVPLDEPIEHGPWTHGDRLRVVSRVVLGLAGLVVAWYGCSGTISFEHSLMWIAAATAAVAIGVTGMVSWLLHGLAEVKRATAGILVEVRAGLEDAPGEVSGKRAEPVVHVAAAGMRRYHLPTCELVVGKQVSRIRPAGRRPCGMCIR